MKDILPYSQTAYQSAHTGYCLRENRLQQSCQLFYFLTGDKSIVSSGNYERYFKKDGKIYHHILDPSTGYPIENNLNQVTIISDKSVDGDALSTTCYALGLDEGLKLIRSMDNIEAVFITDDNTIYKSSDSVDLITDIDN